MTPQADLAPMTVPRHRPSSTDPFEGPDDETLLAHMLARTAPSGQAGRMAAFLFERFGGLAEITAADDPELTRIDGIDAAVLADLKTLRRLCERLARTRASARPALSSWTAVLAYARVALGGAPREQFRALYLDRKNQLLKDELVGFGTVDHAPVYPREVVRRALEVSASAIILMHNHPSGDPQPSRADVEMTRKVVDAARVFDIPVHDHLIIGREGTASFRALGLLP